MSAQRHPKRPTWNTIKRVAALRDRPPIAGDRVRFRPTVVWYGRCPAFPPTPDERRGRMAHYAD